MTMMFPRPFRCAICGTESEFEEMVSTSTFGQPDLDYRPAEMLRSSMDCWIQKCPSCHYSAPTIEKAPQGALEMIKTEAYRDCYSRTDVPELAKAFLCWSHIAETSGKFNKAGIASLHAAWVCDDNLEEEKARECRSRALDMLGKAKKKRQKFGHDKDTERTILIDLLRRTGQFDKAMELANKNKESGYELTIYAILEFQRKLIENSDPSCHTISEAFDALKQ